MKIYVARHGEIELNAENRVCGVSNGELTERGRKQAERLAEELSCVQFDAVFSSPQKRALQTAQPTATRCGLPVLQEPRLAEQNYGIYEGVPRDDIGFLNNKRQFAFRYPGGESMMQVAARVYSFLDELKGKYPHATVLLVTHGGVFRVLNSYFENMTNEEFFRFGVRNCEWKCYEY
jgi:broad specificity phosphatase PhoE